MAVALALHFFGISDASPTTRTALENYLYAERATWEWPQHANLLTLTMLTPEIQVARGRGQMSNEPEFEDIQLALSAPNDNSPWGLTRRRFLQMSAAGVTVATVDMQ